MNAADKPLHIFTIGHSSLSFEDFLSLLKQFDIRIIADIRRYPGSRKFPHFNKNKLEALLAAENIDYLWFENLGGRRHTAQTGESANAGLKSAGFRSYADHMLTDEFNKTLHRLLSIAAGKPLAIMCAEKLYWKCHRRLLSDFLTANGVLVEHIIAPDRTALHRLTPGAVVSEAGTVTYPSPAPQRPDRKLLFDS